MPGRRRANRKRSRKWLKHRLYKTFYFNIFQCYWYRFSFQSILDRVVVLLEGYRKLCWGTWLKLSSIRMRAVRDLRPRRHAVLRSAEVGVRVRRGPDWEWDDQDGGGLGTTIRGCDEDGWVSVKWDAGGEYKYRVGVGGHFDLIIVNTPCSSPSQAARQPQTLRCCEAGIRVRRGPDWKWGEQDAGGFGTTLGSNGVGPGWVQVRWDQSGSRGAYRIGAFGQYDLFVVEAVQTIGLSEAEGSDPPPTLPQAEGVDGVEERRGQAPLAAQSAQSAQGSDSSAASDPGMAEPESIEPQLLPAGHDEEWLDPVEANSMQCPVCMCVARDALAHDCGNLFCEVCWTRWISENCSCPVCREDGASIVKAPRDQRKINNLMIKCPLGCEEIVRLGDKGAHLSRCVKRTLQCSQCGKEMLAERLLAHQEDSLQWHWTSSKSFSNESNLSMQNTVQDVQDILMVWCRV